MWEILLFIGIIAVAAVVIYFVKTKVEKPRPTDIDMLPIKTFPKDGVFKYWVKTPNGVKLWSNVVIPEAAYAAIEGGISNTINAALPGWTAAMKLSDYEIMFVDPDAESMEGYPAIMVSIYKSAGTVIGVPEGFIRPVIILPHHEKTGWKYLDWLFGSAWSESEHVVEWENDKALFYQLATAGDVHPHRPIVAAPRLFKSDGFKSVTSQDVGCRVPGKE